MSGKKYIDLKENDFVEFHLFPDLPSSAAATATDSKGKTNLSGIDEVKESIDRVVGKVAENYIWHNEGFQIYPKNLVSREHSNLEDSEAFSFYGSLNYGENIEDEWFLVYILLELTKQIKGLVVRVKDTDGEFLLIEAAEYLPSWITPDTCENRVFLYDGHIQILPKSFMPSNGEEFVVTEEVVKFVRDNSDKTRAKDGIQRAIQKRIAGYPDKVKENFHRANLYVPVAVAALLDAKPSLIAPAVRAFYERDLLDIKACQAMKYFPPENRVLTHVTFTRCLYAMLATSKYLPDKKTGWSLPHPNDETYKSHLFGVKVACGFEILQSQIKGRQTLDDESEDIDFTNDPNWKKFLQSLSSKNYFRGLLERSQEHDQLMEAAKDFYRKSCAGSVKPNRAREISDLLETLDIDVEELRKRERNLPKSDDDSWMTITQEDLDAMLEARFGRGPRGDPGGDLVNGNRDIASHLKAFIDHVSGIEGAEFPNRSTSKGGSAKPKGLKTKKSKTVKFSPDTKLHSSTSDEGLANGKAPAKIQFEPDGFINAIQNILDFSIPDDNYWESEGSGMSSYDDESDLELGDTTSKSTTKSKGKKDLIEYMHKMDEELANTTMAKSFETKKVVNGECNDNFDDIETFKPVDIDRNAFKNILSSYRAQLGKAGPAENLLGPLGVSLEDTDVD